MTADMNFAMIVSGAMLLIPDQSDINAFFFNDTATTEIYTLSLHDALPIKLNSASTSRAMASLLVARSPMAGQYARNRSEEHTSELQSHLNLVCRLLLE